MDTSKAVKEAPHKKNDGDHPVAPPAQGLERKTQRANREPFIKILTLRKKALRVQRSEHTTHILCSFTVGYFCLGLVAGLVILDLICFG